MSIAIALLPVTWSCADAGGGRFLTSLVARGAVAAARGGTSTATKSYTADVLTVAQLATCIRNATKLDADSDQTETSRTALQASMARVDQSSTAIETQRDTLNRSSKASVNAFNAAVARHNALLESVKTEQASFNAAVDVHNGDVNSYNTACAKKYYADNLAEAQKQASVN